MRDDLGGKAVVAVERITGNLRHASLIAQIPHLSVMLGKRLRDLLNVPGAIFYETHFAPLLLWR